MKKLILVAAMATMLPVAAIAAEEHNHSGQGASPEDSSKQGRMMQENMIKMHEQMHKIIDAKDPAERERLMQEQQKTMQEHMKQMGAGMDGKMGPGTMGGGPKTGAGN
jgi:erythromycin esterase-like protein